MSCSRGAGPAPRYLGEAKTCKVVTGQAGGNGHPLLTIFLVNGTVIILTVLIHYEFLFPEMTRYWGRD